ncbi:UPF0149 family protein [Bowmanella denitrificans]|uniref:YecA/YgfB family protein n=1 Tax=Bowmanella denitrificans TaxID=366582 RepID=UPI000C99E19F|nr:UPF0149 family protein [Bowmanella denitrificans]
MHKNFSYPKLVSLIDTMPFKQDLQSADYILGMLTAVASAPTLILPSDWTPLLWRDDEELQDLKKPARKQLEQLVSELLTWWDYCMSCFGEPQQLILPEHLTIGEDAIVSQSVKEFAEGYLVASKWLDEVWQDMIPEEGSPAADLRSAVLVTMLQCYKEEMRNQDDMPDFVAKIANREVDEFALDKLLSALGELGAALYEDYAEADTYLEDYVPIEEPYVNPMRDVGRNDPCPCGSGKKYKRCCALKLQ